MSNSSKAYLSGPHISDVLGIDLRAVRHPHYLLLALSVTVKRFSVAALAQLLLPSCPYLAAPAKLTRPSCLSLVALA